MTEKESKLLQGELSEEAVDLLRQTLLKRLSRILVFLGPVVVAFGVYHAFSFHRWAVAASYLVTGALTLLLLLIPGVSARTRAMAVTGLMYVLGFLELVFYGWEGDARLFMIGFPLLGVLFFGRRIGFLLLGVTVATQLLFGGLITLDLYTPLAEPFPRHPGFMGMFSNTFIYFIVAALLVYAQDMLFRIASEELTRAHTFSKELQQQQAELDQRAESLQALNYAMQRRTMHLEAAGEIARVLGSIFDVDQLLKRAAELITDRLGFYHVGIFLVSSDGERVVLVAASSEGGRQMLAQGHELHRGEGMVGWVLEHREPRIALDVGEDARHFANPYLPATRSEATVPLLARDRLIGILDVQSVREADFDQDDIRSLKTLANYLALAVDNARRLSRDAGFVEATSASYRMAREIATASTSRDIYAIVLQMVHERGAQQAFIFMLDREHATAQVVGLLQGAAIDVPDHEVAVTAETPGLQAIVSVALEVDAPLFVKDATYPDEAISAVLKGRLQELAEETSAQGLAMVPAHMRGPDMGMLVVYYQTVHVFTPSERRFYSVLADITSVSLERTMLRQRTESQLSQELTVGDIVRKLRSSLDPDTIMRTAVQELGLALGAEMTSIEVTGPVHDTSDLLSGSSKRSKSA